MSYDSGFSRTLNIGYYIVTASKSGTQSVLLGVGTVRSDQAARTVVQASVPWVECMIERAQSFEDQRRRRERLAYSLGGLPQS